jgi:hypothetical protein
MAITVKHKFVSTIPDGADTSVVRPSNWNDDHDFTGTLPVANGGTGAATANDAFNALAPSQTGNTGKYLTTDGTNTSWATNPLGTVTSVAATVPSFLNITGSPITTSGTLAIGYSGTALPVANGGTGVTTSSGANSVVLRDANQNIYANAIDDGYTNVAASGTQITLTAASNRRFTITGSGGQVIKLPDATTLVNGAIFEFDNNQSSGAITVNNNSNTLVASIPSGGIGRVDLLSNSIAAGSWDKHDLTPANVSWSTNTLDYPGSITSATWNGNAVAINRGGTGQATASAAFNALSPLTTAGDVLYGGTSGAGTRLAIGTAGQVLTVNAGATAPQWSTPTNGTVTSVAALTLGTTGTDLSSSVATNTTTPVITLNVPTASATNRGALSAADWTTFNNKGSGTVTSVVGTGTVNGITLTGTVTSTGNITLGGTLSGIDNSQLTNSAITINGTSTSLGGSISVGTVTSVGLSAGTGITVSGSPITSSGSITVTNSAPMTYPSGSGIAVVSGGSSWGTTLTAPSGAIVGTTDTQTLTSKRVTPRSTTTASSATPTINTDTTDIYGLTAQAVDITSFTTNLSGTPTDGQKLWIYIVGTAARAITWGASFESSTAILPTTTVSTNRLDIGFVWNTATSKWRCVAVA